jgi:hypothetical protein
MPSLQQVSSAAPLPSALHCGGKLTLCTARPSRHNAVSTTLQVISKQLPQLFIEAQATHL